MKIRCLFLSCVMISVPTDWLTWPWMDGYSIHCIWCHPRGCFICMDEIISHLFLHSICEQAIKGGDLRRSAEVHVALLFSPAVRTKASILSFREASFPPAIGTRKLEGDRPWELRSSRTHLEYNICGTWNL